MRLLLLALLLAPAAAWAGEDSDLNLIPPNLAAPAPAPPATAPAPAAGGPQLYLEDAGTLNQNHGNLPVPPPGPQQNWQERIFLDARGDQPITDALHLLYSGRFNLQAENDMQNPSSHSVRLDARELYAAWQPLAGLFLDAGRVNLKNGVANGYNPTDFFAARAVVDPDTADPTVLREDRLGTGMLQGQYLWAGGAATLAYAPRLAAPAPIRAVAQLPSFDPLFDQTNTTDRFLAKTTVRLADDLAPELLLYHAGAETRVGANLAQSLGRATVLYGEWSGGMEPGLAAQALGFAVDSGMAPPTLVAAAPVDFRRTFHNDLAIGGSYTTEAEVSFILEYDIHEAGLTAGQLRRLYSLAASGDPAAGSAMWLIRDYANDQQQPLGRQQAFARVSWNDAFVQDLELDAFAIVSAEDGSAMTQLSATYDINDRWRVGALATATTGGRRSVFGGQNPGASLIAKLARYF